MFSSKSSNTGGDKTPAAKSANFTDNGNQLSIACGKTAFSTDMFLSAVTGTTTSQIRKSFDARENLIKDCKKDKNSN